MTYTKEDVLTELSVEWLDELPVQFRPSPFDEVAKRVADTGEVAKVESTKNSVYTLASRLRKRYKDQKLGLKVQGRATQDGWFIFIAKEGK